MCGFFHYPLLAISLTLCLPLWLTPSFSCLQQRSDKICTLQNSTDWRESQREKWDQSSLTGCSNKVRCKKSVGQNNQPCSGTGRTTCPGTFLGSGRLVPLRLCAGGLVARQDQSFVLIPCTESRQTEGDGTNKPLYQDLIYFPKQFCVFMRLRKCGGSKITVINWNSECASMALIIWRSSISLMAV